LILWTIALLIPVPDKSAKEVLGSDDRVFILHKLVHISAYAFLTIVAGLMTLTTNQRWLILLLLSFHGFATEFLQGFVNRGSSIYDVGFDHIGILIGLITSWKRWQVLLAPKIEVKECATKKE
jgi:VanZ family protein